MASQALSWSSEVDNADGVNFRCPNPHQNIEKANVNKTSDILEEFEIFNIFIL